MKGIEGTEVRLTAEDLEFVPSRVYVADHGCGATIVGVGRDMHDAMLDHTAECEGTRNEHNPPDRAHHL